MSVLMSSSLSRTHGFCFHLELLNEAKSIPGAVLMLTLRYGDGEIGGDATCSRRTQNGTLRRGERTRGILTQRRVCL